MLLVAQGSPCPWCPFGPTGLQVPSGFASRSGVKQAKDGGGFQPQVFESCLHVQQWKQESLHVLRDVLAHAQRNALWSIRAAKAKARSGQDRIPQLEAATWCSATGMEHYRQRSSWRFAMRRLGHPSVQWWFEDHFSFEVAPCKGTPFGFRGFYTIWIYRDLPMAKVIFLKSSIQDHAELDAQRATFLFDKFQEILGMNVP